MIVFVSLLCLCVYTCVSASLGACLKLHRRILELNEILEVIKVNLFHF